METRACGASGLRLSVLGLGCWSFGGGDYWGPQAQDDVDLVVNTALDLGINYFDTAPAYNDGRSETSLGLALKERRQEAIIGSKVMPQQAATPQLLRQQCEGS